jgi:type I restriction enzyme S subunit
MKRNWEYKKLGDVAKISSGKSIAAEKISDFFCDGMFPCYGGNGLRGYTDSYLYEGKYPIIGRVGALCGNVHLTNGKFYPTEHALIVSLKSDDAPEYITYLLSALRLNRYAKGVAQPVLSAGTLSEIVVPVPPLEEQSRIVAKLDLLTGIIDKQNAQLKELDNLAQSIFYDMFGDPIENPKGWKVKKLGEVTNKISDGVHAKPHYTESGMPFISVVNINRGKLNFEGCKFVSQTDGELFNKRTKPEKGDVLYTKVGATYGISALIDVDVKFCLYVSVCLIKPKREIFDSLFLTHMMRLPYVKNQADERIRGIGVPDLHLNQISAFDVILPPLALQQSFAEKIQSIEKQKETIRASIADTQKLLDYTMDKYFG